MKKLIYAVCSLLMFMMPLTMVSCGGDEENDQPTDPSKLEAELGFRLTVPEDVTTLYTITAKYTDSHGFYHDLTMPTTANKGYCTMQYIETVKSANFPATAKVEFTIATNGKKPSVDRINTLSGLEIYAGVYRENGTAASSATKQITFGSESLQTTRLDAYITGFNASASTFVYEVTKDGKVYVK